MKFLLDIPWIMAVAEWVWGDGTAVDDDVGSTRHSISPEYCVQTLPFGRNSMGCWSRLVAKCLGLIIIAGACIIKLPMILNLLASKSAQGLSKQALYGEVILIANSAAYGMLQNYPFTAYGENLALLIQAIVIVLLTWQYSSSSSDDHPAKIIEPSSWEKYSVTFLAVLYVVIVANLPTEFYPYLVASSWPVLIYSRGMQIYTSFQAQHTGAQSGVTLTLNTVGATLRIFTTIQEVGFNFVLLCQFGLGFLTNAIMLGQYLYYRKNTQQFWQQEMAKKKTKKIE